MCGIIGYFGNKEVLPILINGLKRLEYRGYDSAGLAVMTDDSLQMLKKSGKVSNLEQNLDPKNFKSTIGIAHTRWATHGEPNDINAHPHLDQTGKIALIHNGIIENYNVLKKLFGKRGCCF